MKIILTPEEAKNLQLFSGADGERAERLIPGKTELLEEKFNQAVDIMAEYAFDTTGKMSIGGMRDWLLRRCAFHPMVMPWRDREAEDHPTEKRFRSLILEIVSWKNKTEGLQVDLNSAIQILVDIVFGDRSPHTVRDWLRNNYGKNVWTKQTPQPHPHGLTALLDREFAAGMREAKRVISANAPHGKTQEQCVADLEARIKDLEGDTNG